MLSSGRPWSVCQVALIPCAVGAVTLMRILLFVWDVSALRECVGCEYMGSTRG